MRRGLWTLTWIELKIFLREPLGAIGTVVIPVVFVALGRLFGSVAAVRPDAVRAGGLPVPLPVLGTAVIAVSSVLSLVTIVAIYREGGILKRLRATPLHPQTILLAHVLVKMLLTGVTLTAMVIAGGRYVAWGMPGSPVGFAAAVVISLGAVLSLGFVIASLVPTARFAQPVGALVLYPMLAMSGLFAPVAGLPPALRLVARALPLTPAVALLEGAWRGDPWSAHLGDLATIALIVSVCTLVSTRVFRWE